MANISETLIYVGYDGNNYFNGTMDEVRIYSIYIEDAEIAEHYEKSGMFWENHKRYLSVHFNFDKNINTSQLQYPEYIEDKSWRQIHGIISGNPTFVQSQIDEAKFPLSYPGNKRKKRSLEDSEPRDQAAEDVGPPSGHDGYVFGNETLLFTPADKWNSGIVKEEDFMLFHPLPQRERTLNRANNIKKQRSVFDSEGNSHQEL